MTIQPDGSNRKKVVHYDNGEPHFLTFSCYHRLPLFSKDRTRKWFVDSLDEARTTHGFHLWAWVIMPEHIHLLLWPPISAISPDPDSMRGRIRGILSTIKRPVATKAINYLRKNARDFLQNLEVITPEGVEYRFWQSGSGHDENVTEPTSLHALVEYIHLNPVRRGLVERAEDWPWSSIRDWNGLPNAVLKVDRTIPDTLDIPWTMRQIQ